ncbi:MAG: hypothetical protein JWN21_1153 [Sphingomonas bacterium]|nr:hypothetical protein [Sphingomonas bacterium]
MGAQVAWRQLVDLIGRGRVTDVAGGLDRLRALRQEVPTSVRAASARAIVWGMPPVELVALFAEDETAVAAPVLRAATLTSDDWLALLPTLTPAARAVLRHRRDLPSDVVRGLESFGATDFVIADGSLSAPVAAIVADVPDAPEAEPVATIPAETPFVPVGDVARGLPVVAEAMRQAAEPPRSEIADLVARIEAFRRDKPVALPPVPNISMVPADPSSPCDRFRFETDALGVIRWVEGVARAPLIGVTLAHAAIQGVAQVDAAAGGALRARSAFRDVRLELGGSLPIAGSWRLSGVPDFDRATGRFVGIAGAARRVEKVVPPVSASDSLRQLVHELRTPANAIAGFSELIGTALLGPVPPVYRDRALLIQREAAGLIAAIDDLDTAARLEGDAMELRSGTVDLGALLARLIGELRPAAGERGPSLVLDAEPGALIRADDRAVERLLERLLTTLVAVAAPGERLRAQLAVKTRLVRLHLTRPRALPAATDDALLAMDDEAEREGGPLLGVGFTLRLVRNLAASLGGSLTVTSDRLTLRLPAAQLDGLDRAAVQ